MKDVMNLEELSAYLRMSRASIYHLVAAGKIPGTKIGKQWRFSRDTIERWLQGNVEGHQSDILVVDDDPHVLELVTSFLRKKGNHCVEADSAKKAVSLIAKVKFDVIILDLILKDGNGIDIIQAVNAASKLPFCIVMTGHSSHPLVDILKERMPNILILSKPVRLSTLSELVSKTLRYQNAA